MTLTEISERVQQTADAAQAKVFAVLPLHADEIHTEDAYRNLYKSTCHRLDGMLAMNGTLKVLLMVAIQACPEGEQEMLLAKLNEIAVI